MNKNEIHGAIVATLFVAGDAVGIPTFAELLDIDIDELERVLQEIIQQKEECEDGLLIVRIEDKIQLCTNPKYAKQIQTLLAPQERISLSKSILETLSIVAYKQPVTRSEVDEIRGVRSNYAISTLLEKGLIYVVGRKDVLGRPSLFATTDEFLRHFGIASLQELPKIAFEESESGLD